MKASNITRFASLILLFSIVILILVGCADRGPSPEDTIFALQEAINHFDTEALLACINDDWAESACTVLEFTIGDTNISASSFFAVAKTIMPMLPLLTDGAINKDDIPSVSFTILQSDIEENEATIALSGLLTWGKITEPFAATVTLQLENDEWVIIGVR